MFALKIPLTINNIFQGKGYEEVNKKKLTN